MFKNEIKEKIQEGLIEEAKDHINQYKKIFGYDDEIASMEAIISIYNGNFDEALNFIRTGLKFNIFNGDLYYTMGNVYELLKQYDRAYLCYEHALEYIELEENKKVALNAIENLKKNFIIDVKKMSIVILTFNQLQYTKVCIESIKKYNTNKNYEIIIVDNNSTDGTVEWLKKQSDIKYILNNENKGFPAGCNQGIEISQKDNDIFLLNNDTVIMPNSIFNLRMGLYSEENVGAAGSVSNSISYYQQISEQYEDFNGYMDFATRNNISNEFLYEKRVKLVGFAMLIKRNVLNKVGLLDERFTPGNFEDDDLSLRIISNGYKLILCKDSYIHHFGSISFKENNVCNYNDLIQINSKKFKEKWGFVSEYSTGIRYDLTSLINENKYKKMNILEIGCACGATLLDIKNNYPESRVYGIEINKEAAKIAKHFADVRDENIENSELTYEDGFFDYIIFGDVLEHLYNPEKVLENMKKYLKDGGYILASIPNVMHYSVIRDLLNGNWTYQEAGILDKTHVRFFTKNEIKKMFDNTQYKEIEIKNIILGENEFDEDFIRELKKLTYVNISDEFNVYQYIVKAKNILEDSEEIKREFAFLLRRIEFDVDFACSEKKITKYIKNEKIKLNTIIDIIKRKVVNKINLLNYLAIKCWENNKEDMVIPLLNEAYYLNSQDLDTIYNLAYVLNLMGEKDMAFQYLNNLDTTNSEVEELKRLIIGGEIDEQL